MRLDGDMYIHRLLLFLSLSCRMPPHSYLPTHLFPIFIEAEKEEGEKKMETKERKKICRQTRRGETEFHVSPAEKRTRENSLEYV